MAARSHRHDLDWAADETTVFTLPRHCFDTEKPHVTITYTIPRFDEAGGYTVWRHTRGSVPVVTDVGADTAKRIAAAVADDIGGPILTPVRRRDAPTRDW